VENGWKVLEDSGWCKEEAAGGCHVTLAVLSSFAEQRITLVID